MTLLAVRRVQAPICPPLLSANATISSSDYRIDTRTSSTDLPPGGNYTTGNLTRTVSGVPDGSYYLGVITDGSDIVSESNEVNNTGYDASPQVSISTPNTYDLVVSSVDVLYATGPNITFSYTLGNNGTGEITVTFYYCRFVARPLDLSSSQSRYPYTGTLTMLLVK